MTVLSTVADLLKDCRMSSTQYLFTTRIPFLRSEYHTIGLVAFRIATLDAPLHTSGLVPIGSIEIIGLWAWSLMQECGASTHNAFIFDIMK
jgi:hypothetical protein